MSRTAQKQLNRYRKKSTNDTPHHRSLSLASLNSNSRLEKAAGNSVITPVDSTNPHEQIMQRLIPNEIIVEDLDMADNEITTTKDSIHAISDEKWQQHKTEIDKSRLQAAVVLYPTHIIHKDNYLSF
ncbi:hypothetical protein BDC45DRAFT_572609 [Circinella umbellata]|nr:hypothetical protein BDC45DRAFT_572609 [Circinella umbellata]